MTRTALPVSNPLVGPVAPPSGFHARCPASDLDSPLIPTLNDHGVSLPRMMLTGSAGIIKMLWIFRRDLSIPGRPYVPRTEIHRISSDGWNGTVNRRASTRVPPLWDGDSAARPSCREGARELKMGMGCTVADRRPSRSMLTRFRSLPGSVRRAIRRALSRCKGAQAVFDRDGHAGEIDALRDDQEAPPVSCIAYGPQDVPPDPPHQPAPDWRGAESQPAGGLVMPLARCSGKAVPSSGTEKDQVGVVSSIARLWNPYDRGLAASLPSINSTRSPGSGQVGAASHRSREELTDRFMGSTETPSGRTNVPGAPRRLRDDELQPVVPRPRDHDLHSCRNQRRPATGCVNASGTSPQPARGAMRSKSDRGKARDEQG